MILPPGQDADQFGIAQRGQKANQRLAFGKARRLLLRHRPHPQQAIRAGRQRAGVADDLRPGGGELGIGNGRRPARAGLHRDGMLLLEQHLDRIGNQRDPGFAIRSFVENSKSHL